MDNIDLVKDCLKGKPAAQRELYEQFARPMLSVCYRYTKSMADAEDVLQEGFVKVFLNLHQYRFQGELGGVDQADHGDHRHQLPEKECQVSERPFLSRGTPPCSYQ